MKKALIALAALFLAAPLFAEVNSNTLTPVVHNRTTNAFTLYIVGGSTTSAATYDVTADSMTLITTGGLYPGTTTFVFAETNKDTIGELITYLNALPATTPGAEGGVVATIVNGCYDGNPSTELAAIGTTACKGVANVKTLTMANILGMSYTLPASGLSQEQQYHITGINANATYAAGTVTLDVYQGTAATGTNILKYKLNATTVETPVLSVPTNGDLAGDRHGAVRFDVVGSSWITAGYMSIIGYKK